MNLTEQIETELVRDFPLYRGSYHEHLCIACGDEYECLSDCDGARGQMCAGCVIQ